MINDDDKIIKICGLKKNYAKTEVLKGINLSIKNNTVVGLIGDNGAGKTTLIKCICGLVQPSEGEIIFLDNNTKVDTYRRKNIGVLLEGARNLYHFLSVEDNLDYFGNLNDICPEELDERKEYLLKEFNLEKYRKKPVNELSRGMQQKVALMVVLIKEPQILILDEPTLGLDLISTIKMIDVLRRVISEGKTIIIISHDLALIRQLCERVILLKDGKINIDDPIDSIIGNNKFVIKLKYNRNIIETIEHKLEYEIDDGIILVRTTNLPEALALFSMDYIISIEKENDTLEKYIRERMVEKNA